MKNFWIKKIRRVQGYSEDLKTSYKYRNMLHTMLYFENRYTPIV